LVLLSATTSKFFLDETNGKRSPKSPEQMDEQLVSDFFDLELEMEKSYCRDLVSTMPQYENGKISRKV
jgi:hypothetical protein